MSDIIYKENAQFSPETLKKIEQKNVDKRGKILNFGWKKWAKMDKNAELVGKCIYKFWATGVYKKPSTIRTATI